MMAAAALGLAGCKGDCRKLAEKLCDCSVNSLEKDACLQRAASEDARVGPLAEDNRRCGELLKICDCNTANTLAGKRACGLAR
jgi:hypothetical protein